MNFIGCDYHRRFQMIAILDEATGEIKVRRLEHANGKAKEFYCSLAEGTLVGIEATGVTQWFERLLAEWGLELWVRDPAKIRARMVRKQKTDERDALHLLHLSLTKRFPRVWVPSPAGRDARQLLQHRQKLVRMRTGVKNQLHGLAMSQGLCRKRQLWRAQGRKEKESLELGPWASRRREELLTLVHQLDPQIAKLDAAVEAEAARWPEVVRLREIYGVGPVVGLAFVLTLGPVSRFQRSRPAASYLGLNPQEDSSSDRQLFGHLTKQGNTMMRWLLMEAAQTAARRDPHLRRVYKRLKARRGAPLSPTLPPRISPLSMEISRREGGLDSRVLGQSAVRPLYGVNHLRLRHQR